jgi:transcriptional pleiotropic regulator of transition state genes
MKALGVVRKLDSLGRIVLPASLRRSLGLEENTPVEILIDGESVVFKKHVPVCYFCESKDNITTYQGKNICVDCITAMFNRIKAV